MNIQFEIHYTLFHEATLKVFGSESYVPFSLKLFLVLFSPLNTHGNGFSPQLLPEFQSLILLSQWRLHLSLENIEWTEEMAPWVKLFTMPSIDPHNPVWQGRSIARPGQACL